MRFQLLFSLVLMWPFLATAEPQGDGDNGSDQWAGAQEALEEKLIELEKLQNEIQRLRKAAGEPQRNVRLRIRLVEVSLTKLKSLGLRALATDNNDAVEVERQIAMLIQKSVAKGVLDKVVTVADGSESRFRSGTELPANPQSKGDSTVPGVDFLGTEIAVTPREQNDGRLAIELVYNYSRPIIYGNSSPQRGVHDFSTVVELAPAEAVVLEGNIDRRIESVSRGVIGLPALSRTTDHINDIQTFIVVSRERRAAGTRTAAVR